MKIHFSINEKDYLSYLLFKASTSELVKKRRLRGKYLVPGIYLALAVIAFLIDSLVLSVILAVFAVLWIAFYPMIQRRQYLRYYQKHIRENFSEKCNIPVSLEFQEQVLLMKDADSEMKMKTSEIKEITEVSDYFYIINPTDIYREYSHAA